MSPVLYPEQLRLLCRAFDETCDTLEKCGARFSRELLARRILDSYGLTVVINEEATRAPARSTCH